VVYPNGVVVGPDSLYGTGTRYDLRLNPLGALERLPLNSVVGFEALDRWHSRRDHFEEEFYNTRIPVR
jgi:hypothetical protein